MKFIIAFLIALPVVFLFGYVVSKFKAGNSQTNTSGKVKRNVKWIENIHAFSDSDFICSNCRKKYDKPYRTCPHCGAQINKIDWDDKDMHDWLDANPGCDEIDYEEYLECDIWDD